MDIPIYLRSKGIQFIMHDHPAVFTCEEAEKYCAHIPGVACKNLFLKDKDKPQFFLVIMPAAKKLDLKQFASMNGARITFGNEAELLKVLGLTKGAVSPFGLLNDKAHATKVFIDSEVWNADIVSFHPNVNTQTLELTQADFQKYIKMVGNAWVVMQ